MSKQNRLPQPVRNGKHQSQAAPSPQRQPQAQPGQPKTKTTKREATEQDELAVKLIAAYEQITQKEQQIATLQIEAANLRLQAANREKQIVEEKYGLRGQVQLTIGVDGKRTLSITTPVEDEEVPSGESEGAETPSQPVDEGANQTAEATPDAPKSN